MKPNPQHTSIFILLDFCPNISLSLYAAALPSQDPPACHADSKLFFFVFILVQKPVLRFPSEGSQHSRSLTPRQEVLYTVDTFHSLFELRIFPALVCRRLSFFVRSLTLHNPVQVEVMLPTASRCCSDTVKQSENAVIKDLSDTKN